MEILKSTIYRFVEFVHYASTLPFSFHTWGTGIALSSNGSSHWRNVTLMCESHQEITNFWGEEKKETTSREG